jgi:hypothetical protein
MSHQDSMTQTIVTLLIQSQLRRYSEITAYDTICNGLNLRTFACKCKPLKFASSQ